MSTDVIMFHYRLTDKEGKLIDASREGHPLIFLSGAGQIVPGLELELIGMETTQKKTITVPASAAYGHYDEALVFRVKRAQLPKEDLTVGDMFEVGGEGGGRPVCVSAIDGDDVTLDGNHPLCGQDLTFALEIVEKRPATPQEIAHGHPHGSGGCEH